jgi:hypothetical protein
LGWAGLDVRRPPIQPAAGQRFSLLSNILFFVNGEANPGLGWGRSVTGWLVQEVEDLVDEPEEDWEIVGADDGLGDFSDL